LRESGSYEETKLDKGRAPRLTAITISRALVRLCYHLRGIMFRMAACVALALTFASGVFADAWEDAAKALGPKIVARLAAGETVNLIWREAAPQNLKTALAAAVRRRVRNPKPVEVRVTLSENLRGGLLVAEIVREDGNIVEMVNVVREQAPGSSYVLKLTPLWEEEPKILDAALLNGEMLVLDAANLTRYRREEGQWVAVSTHQIPSLRVRDLRGYIDASKTPFEIHLPGEICVPDSDARASLRCGEGGMFTAGRNTLAADGWPAHYSHVEAGGEHFLAEVDGKTHVYDAARKPLASFEAWGSDFAALPANCAQAKILAVESSGDAVAAYGVNNRQPVPLGDPVALPGPLGAIWVHEATAVVIAQNVKTGRYEAYGATLDCLH